MMLEELIKGEDYTTVEGRSVLLKAGAEKLMESKGYIAEYEIINNIVDEKRSFFAVKALIKDTQQVIQGVGFGACSSSEKDHWRKDPLGAMNSIMKIAKKRALIDAVISTFNLSRYFTQDIEDNYHQERIVHHVSEEASVEIDVLDAENLNASEKQKEFYQKLVNEALQKIDEVELSELIETVFGDISKLGGRDINVLIDFLILNRQHDYKEIYEFIKEKGLDFLRKNSEALRELANRKITFKQFKSKTWKKGV